MLTLLHSSAGDHTPRTVHHGPTTSLGRRKERQEALGESTACPHAKALRSRARPTRASPPPLRGQIPRQIKSGGEGGRGRRARGRPVRSDAVATSAHTHAHTDRQANAQQQTPPTPFKQHRHARGGRKHQIPDTRYHGCAKASMLQPARVRKPHERTRGEGNGNSSGRDWRSSGSSCPPRRLRPPARTGAGGFEG